MSFLKAEPAFCLLPAAGILIFILYLRRLWVKEGREKEKKQKSKEEALADEKYRRAFNRAVALPDGSLNDGLRGLQDKK